MDITALIYVVIGGAIGSVGRYVMMSLVGRVTGGDFPYGTLVVNVLGGFLMGLLVAAIAATVPAKAKDLHLLLAVGVLGGFTTFSTFSLDVYSLIERGEIASAGLYVTSSVVVSVLALVAGMWCIKLFA